MSRTINGWPILAIAGITAAVVIGLAHASLNKLEDCLFGIDDLGPRTTMDGFGPDGYSTGT